MLTVDEYLGQHGAGHESELTEEIRANAAVTCERANALLAAFGEDRGLRSGWRPAAVNASIPGAASHSRHMTGEAVDVEDNDGALDVWCASNIAALEKIGLWLEAAESTPSWCHVQIVPPRSGHRFFIP